MKRWAAVMAGVFAIASSILSVMATNSDDGGEELRGPRYLLGFLFIVAVVTYSIAYVRDSRSRRQT